MTYKTLANLSLLALFAGLVTLPAAAQTPRSLQQPVTPHSVQEPDPGPPIAELRIGVQDMETKEKEGQYSPGDTLRLEVGDHVRLRMVAIPAEARRAPRYPSTRFQLWSGKARINLTKIDEQVGSVEVHAVRPDNPGNQDAVTMIRFDVIEEINMPERQRGGYLKIEVIAPPPPPPPAPVRPPEPRQERGVTLYEHQDFHGDWQTFTGDVRDLRGTRIRQDRASSVRIDRGCEATLYEHPDFGGRATVVTEDIVDLRETRVGSDTVSSLTLECWDNGGSRGGDWPPRHRDDPGVTLFEHQDFQGDWETFTGDLRDLRGTRIRQDRASSVRIDWGCEAVLYEHPDFEGRATVVTEDIVDLRETRVGNDTVSSLEVDCHRRGRGRR